MKVLAIDPSGTGITGLFFTDSNQKEFYQCQNKDWKDHYVYILNLIKEKQPNLILYEDTNYIHRKTKDGLSLFRLLGALECLSSLFKLEINSVSVLRAKELTKKLLAGVEKLEGIDYQQGRGKGWLWKGQRVSIHQLEAYLVYYLFTRKNIEN